MLNRKLNSLAQPPPVAALAVLLVALTGIGRADAINLYSEDFESLALGPYINEIGGDGTDWTATPPTGITVDNTTTPVGGIPEFFGWTFHDKGRMGEHRRRPGAGQVHAWNGHRCGRRPG